MPGESAGAGEGCEPEEVPLTRGSPAKWTTGASRPASAAGRCGSLGRAPHPRPQPICPCVFRAAQPLHTRNRKTLTSATRPGQGTLSLSGGLPASGLPLQVHLLRSSQRDSSNHKSTPCLYPSNAPLCPQESPAPQPGNKVLVSLASSLPIPQLSHAKLLRSLRKTPSPCTCCSC